jgi:Fe-S-cluster containining protein
MLKLAVLNNENKVCGPCGGKCCKRMPGSALPSDFGHDVGTALLDALLSKRWAIDWWEGDPRGGKNELDVAYFLRPATKGREGCLHDASWGGECTFLTQTGCSLTFERRPSECRGLVPNEVAPGNCTSDPATTKQQVAIAWIPYDALIREVADMIEDSED